MTEEIKSKELPSKWQFHYKKSAYFRVVHADGVIGNITPKNDIFVSFYNERTPLPDSLTFEVSPDGQIGNEILSERKFQTEGILREMEVGIVIDVDFARNLVLWLTNIIQQTENSVPDGENNNESSIH